MSPNNPNRSLPLSALIGNAIQIREGLLTDVVARYAEQMVRFGDTVTNHQGDAWPVLAVFEDADGTLYLADGSHRAHAALKIGAVMMQCRVRKGDKADALRHALGANARHGHPLTNADKRRAAELALLDPVWTVRSNAAIAADIGCSAPLVASVRAGLETAGKAQAAAARRGADGKMYPVKPAPAIEREEVKTVLTSKVPEGEQVSVEDVLAAQAQADEERATTVPSWRSKHVASEDAERAASRAAMERVVAKVVTPETVKAAGGAVGAVVDPGAHQSRDDVSSDAADASGDDWSTPPWLIELCCDVVGLFDLDPASNDAARKIVGARHYFTKLTNGLDKTWKGNVWLNPPYSRDLIKAFAQKAVAEWGRCNIKMMFVLVNTSSSAEWWHQLARAATLTIFLPKRVDFWHPDGRQNNGGRYDQTLFFFSLDPKRIAMCRKVFSDAGALVVQQVEDDD